MSLFEKILSLVRRPVAFPASQIRIDQRQASVAVQVEHNAHVIACLRQLRLGDCMQLVPVFQKEPLLHEVWVLDAQGRKIGRIEDQIGHRLAHYFPWKSTPLTLAQIAELHATPFGDRFGLKLNIPCSEQLWKTLHPTHAIDFRIEKLPKQTVILLNCTDYSFDEICRQLLVSALKHFSIGPPYPTSSKGETFRFALQFSQSIEPVRLEHFFKRVFNCVPAEVLHQQLLEELVKEEENIKRNWERKTTSLHAELVQLKKENLALLEQTKVYDCLHQEFIAQELQTRLRQSALEEQLVALQSDLDLQLKKSRENDRLRKISNRLNEEIPRLLETLLPDLQFEGQSMKVLWRHLYNPQAVLHLLQRLQQDKGLAEAKRVQGVQHWMEVHFSSGKSMDGRLYFSQQGNRMHVLICRKKTQAADIRYIKEHLCPQYHRSQLQTLKKSRKNAA